MTDNNYELVYTGQLDKILEYLKIHKYASRIDIAELVSNSGDALLWLETHNFIRKEIVDDKIRYCLKEIQQNEITQKEVQITNENGKKEKGS